MSVSMKKEQRARTKTPAWPGAFLLLCALLASGGCAPGTALRTPVVTRIDASAAYDVILYGGWYVGDIETVAFLQKTGTGYEFEPWATSDRYRVLKGLRGPDAFEKARYFVSSVSPNVMDIRVKSILAPDGTVLGYEVLPEFAPLVYGSSDLIYVYYFITTDEKVKIQILPVYNRMGGGPEGFEHSGLR